MPRIRLVASETLEEGRVERGASTITQQLAKNLYLNPARTPFRKLKEAVLTSMLEAAPPKARILEVYLNVIEWGRGLYGVSAACQTVGETDPSHVDRLED